jgi:hypothetical protein
MQSLSGWSGTNSVWSPTQGAMGYVGGLQCDVWPGAASLPVGASDAAPPPLGPTYKARLPGCLVPSAPTAAGVPSTASVSGLSSVGSADGGLGAWSSFMSQASDGSSGSGGGQGTGTGAAGGGGGSACSSLANFTAEVRVWLIL